MKQISVSIDKIIIEYTKVSMDFWNGYFMKNICDYYGINPTIHELGFKYQLYLVNPDGTYMHISYRPVHEIKSKHYSLWIETHPEYLGGFKNILNALGIKCLALLKEQNCPTRVPGTLLLSRSVKALILNYIF